jgi:hypothetical protein
MSKPQTEEDDRKSQPSHSVLTGAVAAVAAATVMFTATATAANPHFIFANADIDNNGNLVVSWKEAGLGDNQLID